MSAKAVLRGKFIVIQAYLKKKKKSQTTNLTLHLKDLGRKRRMNKAQNQQKEGNNKDQRETK